MYQSSKGETASVWLDVGSHNKQAIERQAAVACFAFEEQTDFAVSNTYIFKKQAGAEFGVH